MNINDMTEISPIIEEIPDLEDWPIHGWSYGGTELYQFDDLENMIGFNLENYNQVLPEQMRYSVKKVEYEDREICTVHQFDKIIGTVEVYRGNRLLTTIAETYDSIIEKLNYILPTIPTFIWNKIDTYIQITSNPEYYENPDYKGPTLERLLFPGDEGPMLIGGLSIKKIENPGDYHPSPEQDYKQLTD